MGSSQSAPSPSPSATPSPSEPSSIKDDSSTRITTMSSSAATELSGMALVNYQCRKPKRRYDKCVSEWYSQEFMTGKSLNQAEICGDKFDVYRVCVLKGIRHEVWDKNGLPPPKEGSPLAEIEDDLR